MQYYRDNLYYCVEGGIKPIKPSGENAYKLISNVTNYPMTEKREKNSNINIEKINNMLSKQLPARKHLLCFDKKQPCCTPVYSVVF